METIKKDFLVFNYTIKPNWELKHYHVVNPERSKLYYTIIPNRLGFYYFFLEYKGISFSTILTKNINVYKFLINLPNPFKTDEDVLEYLLSIEGSYLFEKIMNELSNQSETII